MFCHWLVCFFSKTFRHSPILHCVISQKQLNNIWWPKQLPVCSSLCSGIYRLKNSSYYQLAAVILGRMEVGPEYKNPFLIIFNKINVPCYKVWINPKTIMTCCIAYKHSITSFKNWWKVVIIHKCVPRVCLFIIYLFSCLPIVINLAFLF